MSMLEMMRSRAMASSSPFRHFASATLRPAPPVSARSQDDDDEESRRAKKAEEDKKKEKDDEDAKAKKKAEEDKKKEDDEKKEKAKKKAEEEDKEKKDKDKKDDDDAKAKAAAIARESSDEADRIDELDPVTRTARARERDRIHAILLSPAAEANMIGALHLATETNMPRAQVIATLNALAAAAAQSAPPKRDSLRDRMETQQQPGIGTGTSGANAPTLADQIIMAGKKRRGEV